MFKIFSMFVTNKAQEFGVDLDGMQHGSDLMLKGFNFVSNQDEGQK